MLKKLVPDARFDQPGINHALLASAETVTIRPGQAQIVHTGVHTCNPLILSLQGGNGKFDMCALLTTALTAGQEVKVAILNRGTDPVTLVPGEMFLVACRIVAVEPLDAGI